MLDSSLKQAVVAVGACLIQIRQLVDARKPSPAWSQNPRDQQRVEHALREIGPQLLESYSRLLDCQPGATGELLAARKRMLDRGGSPKEPVIALGTSGRFALDIACEKIKRAVDIMEMAIDLSHNPDLLVEYIGWIEDSTTPDWTAFCHRLEMEMRDTTAVLAPAGDGVGRVRNKKSTAKGEAQEKIVPALTLHHKYQNGGCLNEEPIGANELARLADVGQASVNRFFDKHFGVGKPKKNGHKKYIGVCRDIGNLVASLKLLNGEFSPSTLYGRNPPNEGQEEENE
jgi:hypothetical protein